MFLECGRFRLSSQRPLIMGIINVTPDSFSDGGELIDPTQAIDHAHRLLAEGADLLDIGGESTRPGAQAVSALEEWRRIEPVLLALRDVPVPISVDTMKPGVMRAAIDHGAAMINDVNALRAPGALQVVAQSTVAVCLMHMQGEPRTMQRAPHYLDVVQEVKSFLRARIKAALEQGIAQNRIIIDPGIGFGKTMEHNFALLRELSSFAELEQALLIGWSRKSSLGQLTGKPVADRLAASLAAALLAAERGATIVRVHDVAATRDAVAVLNAIQTK